MAFTRHGHHIPGTILDGKWPEAVARCGGPRMCNQCAQDVAQNESNALTTEHYDEYTLVKVVEALRKVGMASDQALDAINEMQNRGILFRERR